MIGDGAPKLPLADAAAEMRARHDVTNGAPEGAPVWSRAARMTDWLQEVRSLHIGLPHPAAKANEWLLDNEFHVRRAVRQVTEDMPPAFYRRLPALAAPELGRMPRVLALAHGMLAVTHMQVGLGGAVDFVRDYQQSQPLTIAELWAFPAMLRLACLEILVTAFCELEPVLTLPFTPSPVLPTTATMEPTERVSHAISALIAISVISWKTFFEDVSQVEAILRQDPSGVYALMDFATRDTYRKVIEDLARGAGLEEWSVATTVMTFANQHKHDIRLGHVGGWLVGEGLDELKKTIGFHPPRAGWLARLIGNNPGRAYAASLILFACAALILPGFLLAGLEAGALVWLVGMALSLMPAMIISVTLTQYIITRTMPPRTLPKMKVDDGLPPSCPSVLVMPVIFRRATEVAALVEKLETHWLSNPDPMIRMVMLSDLADASSDNMPGDDAIVEALLAGIDRLNGRYPDHQPFGLLHRPRTFNPAEGCWMGWERKRGKLEAFSRFLLGQADHGFVIKTGSAAFLSSCRFVVTMDADTVAPPGAINRLIGTLAHPLNVVGFEDGSNVPVHGYTFLQPRVEISPAAGDRSWFTRLFTGDTAIDIYSRAVSDIYQDLFGEGIFIGKGVFDVAAFHRCLANVVPEDTLVSHDLFEGLHGRAALVSDIVFYEDFPPNYQSYSKRALRWIRGDWQLLPWLFRSVPTRNGDRVANVLSRLDRWKIVDNLRRSLIPPAMVALAVAGWTFLPGTSLIWTLLTVAAPGAYLFTELVTSLARGRRRGSAHGTLRRLADHAGRWFLAVVFMAHEATNSLRAISVTLWRLFVSRRHLLEWTSAAHTADDVGSAAYRRWRDMAGAPILAGMITALILLLDPANLAGAAPLLLLWFVSPEIAGFIGRPRPVVVEQLDAADRLYLRGIARRTWLFFETFAGADDHWLPPDNIQGPPHADIAHRTSPTNVGMLMLSTLTAQDLGHIGLRDLAARMIAVCTSLDLLESHQGHMLNWIDTRTLKSLEPRYVSAVDSGNLAVSLLALKQGCLEALDNPVIGDRTWDGLEDVIGLLYEAAGLLPRANSEPLQLCLGGLMDDVALWRADPSGWQTGLESLRSGRWKQAQGLLRAALAVTTPQDGAQIAVWAERTEHHLASVWRDLHSLFPWGGLLQAVPNGVYRIEALMALLPDGETSLRDAPARLEQARLHLQAMKIVGEGALTWADAMRACLVESGETIAELVAQLEAVAKRANDRAYGMEFGFLYDRGTRTFFIGYNLGSDRLDQHHYDLLASEARLTSYFAIAKRDVPVEHWFHLGRPIAEIGGSLSILSWNGSMFEYLMPPLLLPSEPGRLLGQSERAAVEAQRRYALQLNRPWGVSESGYAAQDVGYHYQYQAFGIPGLGLKRDLSANYVVSPYATALALAIVPKPATENLRALEKLGLSGIYGFVEAADYTPDRRPLNADFAVVNAHMAHHQGMIMAAIGNALFDNNLVARFLREPHMRATELLLQERVPWEFSPDTPSEPETAVTELARNPVPALHGWSAADQSADQVHVIGNGSMSSWITTRGAGALWWRDQSLTRWTGDDVRRVGNGRLYINEPERGQLWSFGDKSDGHPSEAVFHAHKAEIHEHTDGLTISMEIGVANGDDVEVRRLTLSNDSPTVRTLDVTTYAEIVLSAPSAHERHPAFSKLFIRSELDEDSASLIFTRRPRRKADHPPVLLHRLLSWDDRVSGGGFETDRAAFLGRHGESVHPPGAAGTLSGSTGWTLDPIMACRARIVIEPGEKARLAFITLAAPDKETALATAQRFGTEAALDWLFEDSMHSTAIEAHRIGLDSRVLAEAQAFCSALTLGGHATNVPIALLKRDLPAQSTLWSLGLSGDMPVILVRMAGIPDGPLLDDLVRIHHWWRIRNLRADIVVLSDGMASYQEPVRDKLLATMSEAGLPVGLGEAGGFHFLNRDRVGPMELEALESSASLIVDGVSTSLREGAMASRDEQAPSPRFVPVGVKPVPEHGISPVVPPITFSNGLGGFADDNSDYVLSLDGNTKTPVAWCNVLTNDSFGTIVSEAGLGFTWSVNSGEHRLTPWSNDPLLDPQSEAIYLRDEETSDIWSPTPLPAGGSGSCLVRHGAGVTSWTRTAEGLEQTLSVFVPADAPVKIALLTLRNLTDRDRRITATYFAEWLMGAMASVARPHVVCDYDGEHHALLARNGWNPEFANRVAFLTCSRPPHSLTSDRTAFLGRPADMASPAGLQAWSLDGRVSNVVDPCAAYQAHIDIRPGGTQDLVFVLGEGADMAEATSLAAQWAHVGRARDALAANETLWAERLGKVHVTTPDPAFDIMVNRWLLQQTMTSRIQARAGFHQAGGAFGFRDQLQDMLALLMIEPDRVRAHLLDSASRQFEEGDVLHWWHPPLGRGIRTRCSDDLLWLVYVTGRYVSSTGDMSILGEEIDFLSAPPLGPDEEDRYTMFDKGRERGTLFEHCRRAMDHANTSGIHGLPLMGSGDWNDGMDRVGVAGRGESVWLGWFLAICSDQFAKLADLVGQPELALHWAERAVSLRLVTDREGWDGAWYMRAFDDSHQPLGSSVNPECRIDSIAQSFAVLASGPDKARLEQALAAARDNLVDAGSQVVRLLAPPFDVSPRDPGYIQAYPPGVRENGGQYTHAAAWLGLAHAALGDGDNAWNIFNIINPVTGSDTKAGAQRYRGEPYVLAGDVVGAGPTTGQAGWTWYTGAAGWTWQLAVHGILGIHLEAGAIRIAPNLPRHWGSAEITLSTRQGTMTIVLDDGSRLGTGTISLLVDDVPVEGCVVSFPGAGRHVRVRATIAEASLPGIA